MFVRPIGALVRAASAAALVVLLAACAENVETADTGAAGGEAMAASAQTTDIGDIRDYELRMEQVDKYYAAFRNIAQAMQRMTPAEREQLNTDASTVDLNAYVAKLEQQPEINRAIRDAGLTPREFSLILWSMLQSGMASAVLQTRPNANEDSLAREMNVSMANVRFMREHDAELRQRQQALDVEMRDMGLEEEPDTI
jgi:hypothetical protein